MRRRRFIVATGSVFATAAGCVSGSDDSNGTSEENGDTGGTGADGTDPDSTSSDGSNTTNSSADDTAGDGTNADDTSADDTKDTDEGDGAGASFDAVECPSFSKTADKTVCSHTKTDDAAVYPTVSQDVFTPTTDDERVETLQIQVHNESTQWFSFNPHEWQLKRQTEDGWEHVAPEMYVEPWFSLEAGQTYTWELSVESHPSPNDKRSLTITEDLDSGTYAFQMTGVLRETLQGEDTEDDEWIECIGVFTVSRK